MTSKPAFLNATTIQKIPLCTRSQLKGVVTYVRARARVHTYVCSLLGGRGLIIEPNIPMQELEGQRGEGAYFREDTVHVDSRRQFVVDRPNLHTTTELLHGLLLCHIQNLISTDKWNLDSKLLNQLGLSSSNLDGLTDYNSSIPLPYPDTPTG